MVQAATALTTGQTGSLAKGMSTSRQTRGQGAYHAGRAAEEIVARDYMRRAGTIAHRRWRGQSGEVDLIAREGDRVVFIEVKKSSSFSRAAERLGPRQIARLCHAAEEFVANEPRGQLTEMRFDLALVNATGQVQIIENAFCEA